MKYVSIDIETTGLDREQDQIIEFGAILEDTLNPLPFKDTPKFHAIVKHDRYSGGAFAINLNQRIFKILADRILIKDPDEKVSYDIKHNICKIEDLAEDFYNWLFTELNKGGLTVYYHQPLTITAAGKNYAGFDGQFLNHVPDWNKLFRVRHRTLDPASLYWDSARDEALPSLEQCLERAGIDNTVVSHDAVEDAWQVIEVLRKKYTEL